MQRTQCNEEIFSEEPNRGSPWEERRRRRIDESELKSKRWRWQQQRIENAASGRSTNERRILRIINSPFNISECLNFCISAHLHQKFTFQFFLRFVFISLSSLLELLFFRLDTQHIWKWKWILIKLIKSEFNENSLATTTRSSRFDFRLRIIANCCLTKNLNLYKKLCERKKKLYYYEYINKTFLKVGNGILKC